MNKINSISTKIISVILIGFIALTFITIYQSNNQLRSIIYRSQEAMYMEKLDIIWNSLDQTNNQLEKTGLVDAYIEDFQNQIISELKRNYYTKETLEIYPIIFSMDSKLIMYPSENIDEVITIKQSIENVTKGESLGIKTASFNPIEQIVQLVVGNYDSNSRGIYSTNKKSERWYIYKSYKRWNWIIAFSVPNEKIYADVDQFINKLMIILVGSFLFIVVFIIIFISGIIKPIKKLTEISSKISHGDLNQIISINTKDEIGILSQSFSDMQQSIRNKVDELNLEINERVEIEKELRFFRNYFYNIINLMPSSIIVVDQAGVISQWNKEAELYFGIVPNNAIGYQFTDIVPRLKNKMENVNYAIQSSNAASTQRYSFKSDGRLCYEDVTIYPIVEIGLKGAVIRIDDVTEYVELEEKLKQSQKMDAIGQLAGGIAHDFNNMLGGIIGATQLLKTPSVSINEKGMKYVNLIEKASTRAADLTNQLLMFSRKKEKQTVLINIDTLILETISLLERSVDKRIEIIPNLKASTPNIMGDDSQIQNLMMNICINATHAIEGNGRIELSTKNIYLDSEYCNSSSFDVRVGEYVSLTIKDNGSGIEEKYLKKIFEPFFTTKEQGKGTGLGLSAVYGVVENHHGEILVESEINVGTIFTINLPVSKRECVEDEEVSKVTNQNGLILIIEDEEILRETLTESLTIMGFDVVVSSNGEEGCSLFKERKDEIDLVILDMIMPGMTGKEVFKQLRLLNPIIKVIISSGYSKNDEINSMNENGLNGFIKKPYTIEELKKVVEKVLAN